MNRPPFSSTAIKIALLVACGSLLVGLFSGLFDRDTKIVFCDVGQGDGAYIRVQNSIDIVVDAGPNSKILDCLGKYMPFYDRRIELGIVTHPQKDHYFGFIPMMDRYDIASFLTPPVITDSTLFQQFVEKTIKKKVPIRPLYAGMEIRFGDARMQILWPTKEYIENNTLVTNSMFGYTQKDPNNFSLIFLLQEAEFKALFTGDASPEVLNGVLQKENIKTDILKVPHHGSKNGLSRDFFSLADPILSVISVGANNNYGHPSKEILDLFKASGRKYLRTDKEGDIVIQLSKNEWRVVR